MASSARALPAPYAARGWVQPDAQAAALPAVGGHAAVLSGSCSAATNAQVSKPQVEPKPAPLAEPVVAAPAVKAADTKAADAEAPAEAKSPAAASSSVSASADKPATAEPPAKFSANPCKGPSAKFLSTCKE